MSSRAQLAILCRCSALSLFLAVRVGAEEPSSQLLTILSSQTLSGAVSSSGSVSAVASGARRALHPGLYASAPVMCFGREVKLALAVFPDGRGFCEVGDYDAENHVQLQHGRGNFTNRVNGLLSGKVVDQRIAFRGHVAANHDGVRLRLVVRQRSAVRVRHVVLERVADLVPQNFWTALSQYASSVASAWSMSDPEAAVQWLQQLTPGGDRGGDRDPEVIRELLENAWRENSQTPQTDWEIAVAPDEETVRRMLIEMLYRRREPPPRE